MQGAYWVLSKLNLEQLNDETKIDFLDKHEKNMIVKEGIIEKRIENSNQYKIN